MLKLSNHSRALVPIESWSFNAPDLAARGIPVDLGHLAESLIYYDQVLFTTANQPQFARVISWFKDQGQFDTFLSLVSDGTLGFYEYSFASAPIYDPQADRYMIVNIQDQAQIEPNSFEERFLYHQDVENVVQKGRQRKKLYEAFRGHVIEAKADSFAQSIEEARKDFADAERNALTIQAFIDEFYIVKKLGPPPKIACVVVENADKSHTVTVNVDYQKIAALGGQRLIWDKGTSLAGSANSHRFLQSASMLGCDLYLAQPMSRLVGDKLYESARAVNKPGEIIETLKSEIEFPNVRTLVNDGRLSIEGVLELRKRAKRFRDWLQYEGDRDRDALIAYHHEVTKESGMTAAGKKALNLFGFVGGPTVGAVVGEAFGGPPGAVVGAAAGGAVSWIADIGSKIGGNWRPVVFGDWYRDRIAELDLARRKQNSK